MQRRNERRVFIGLTGLLFLSGVFLSAVFGLHGAEKFRVCEGVLGVSLPSAEFGPEAGFDFAQAGLLIVIY